MVVNAQCTSSTVIFRTAIQGYKIEQQFIC